MPAAMNDIDWDWARALRNEINWYWAMYYENNMIDLNYEAHNDLTEQKLLNIQYYNTNWTEWIVKTQTFLFERRIIVTEFMIESSLSFMTVSSLTFT